MRASRPPHGLAIACALRLVALALALAPGAAAACASCGSGGDEPLVLYPNERSKVLVGLARMGGIGYLRGDGSRGALLGASARDSLTLAAGLAVGERGAVTVSVPVLRNEGVRGHAVGVGDLFVAARGSVLRQRLDQPAWPQLQITAGFRNAVSPSIYDARRPDLLDVFGSGFDELRLGADLWWAMWPLRFGGALQGGLPFARATAEGSVRPGATLRALGTVGVGIGARAGLQASYSVEVGAPLRVAGSAVDGSGRWLHAITLAGDFAPAPMWAVRASVARVGLPGSVNAQQATTVGVAGTRAW